ncbi:MAG: pyridoxal phosphate-dependent aminotransferase family protein [Candidatus Kuenenia sp.]|nr:pyridoxal phosphate-dependent aminotransferase family protein [Candidatus Kuenenia hertensis]
MRHAAKIKTFEGVKRFNKYRRPSFVDCFQRNGLIYQHIEAVKGVHFKVRGHWIVSFISSCYLGLNQNQYVKGAVCDAVKRWGTSLGTPRILGIDKLTSSVESKIALLTRREKAIIFPSTTQLAIDVLPLLSGPNGALFMDEWAYQTSFEGAFSARKTGAKCYCFKHNDPTALESMLKKHASSGNNVIVCDGVYSSGGQKVSLSDFIEIARRFHALIYVDDAHGIGVYGKIASSVKTPYGYGGGGTPVYFNTIASNRILHVGTLSKAFGVPVAFIAGHTHFIEYLKYHAKAFVHSSPPSLPVLAAAEAALTVNEYSGDHLRNVLYQRVQQFRQGLTRIGIKRRSCNYFPIQTIYFSSKKTATKAAAYLRRMGIWVLLQLEPPDNPYGGVIRFIITCLHKENDINKAIDAISFLQSKNLRIRVF